MRWTTESRIALNVSLGIGCCWKSWEVGESNNHFHCRPFSFKRSVYCGRARVSSLPSPITFVFARTLGCGGRSDRSWERRAWTGHRETEGVPPSLPSLSVQFSLLLLAALPFPFPGIVLYQNSLPPLPLLWPNVFGITTTCRQWHPRHPQSSSLPYKPISFCFCPSLPLPHPLWSPWIAKKNPTSFVPFLNLNLPKADIVPISGPHYIFTPNQVNTTAEGTLKEDSGSAVGGRSCS